MLLEASQTSAMPAAGETTLMLLSSTMMRPRRDAST